MKMCDHLSLSEQVKKTGGEKIVSLQFTWKLQVNVFWGFLGGFFCLFGFLGGFLGDGKLVGWLVGGFLRYKLFIPIFL